MADEETDKEEKPAAPVRPALRRWLQMGIELEGGWVSDYRLVAKKVQGASAKTDQSIEPGRGWGSSGEIITRPHDTLERLITDITTLYPDYTNVSCGFHVHASFTPMDVTMLTDVAFWNYFRKRIETWAKATNQDNVFWDRFHGSIPERARRYQAKWIPEDQLYLQKDRYTQINFVSWHKLRTVECRLFPMWANKEHAISALRELSDIYDTYLNEVAFPTISLKNKPRQVGDMAIEEYKSKLPLRTYWEERDTRPAPHVLRGKDIDYAFPTDEGMHFPSTARFNDEW